MTWRELRQRRRGRARRTFAAVRTGQFPFLAVAAAAAGAAGGGGGGGGCGVDTGGGITV